MTFIQTVFLNIGAIRILWTIPTFLEFRFQCSWKKKQDGVGFNQCMFLVAD